MEKMKREDLLNAIEFLIIGTEERGNVEQADAINISNDCLWAFNDHIYTKAPNLLKDCHNNISIPALDLFNLLKRMTDEVINIEYADSLKIKGRRVKANISCKEVEMDNSSLKIPDKGWKILSSDFIDKAKTCSLSVSNDASTPQFTCIHVNNNIIESCDNYRITMDQLKRPFYKEALIPAGSLYKASSKINGKKVKYNIGNGFIHFKIDENKFISIRVIDAKYPDISSKINLHKKDGIKIQWPKNIQDILGRAMVFSKADIRIDEVIKVTIDKGRMIIEASNTNKNSSFSEIAKIAYQGDSFSFLINPQFILDMQSIETADYILYKEEKKIIISYDQFIHAVQLWEG